MKQDKTILDEATRAALKYEARKLTGATEELLRLLGEFSLLPIGALDAGFNWKLVSRPDEKRLLLSANWK